MAKKKSESELKFLNGKDSKEEVYVEWYLQELKDVGIIADFWYHPEVYILADTVQKLTIIQKKTKNVEKITTFKRGKTYKPDFRVKWNCGVFGIGNFVNPYDFISDHCITTNGDGYLYCKRYMSDLDVKPNFSIRQSDADKFSLIQSMVLVQHKVYVQKIEYAKLFEKTFTPTRFFKTDSGRQARKINWKPITLEQFLRR